MFKYRISGVRKQKWKKKKIFRKRCLGGIFAKFVFTGQAFMLICELKLEEKWKFSKYFTVKYLKLKI